MNLDFGRCLWKRESDKHETNYRKLAENQRWWDRVEIPGKAFKAGSTYVMFNDEFKEGSASVMCLVYD